MGGSKVMTAQEAISEYVHDGDCLALGGFVTNRRAYGLVREIIRQNKRKLYLEGGPAGGDTDLLIGAGCVDIMIDSYIANSGYSMVCRRFRDALENKRILFDDYSLDVQTIAYHGAALGLRYVPVKNMLGSDLLTQWGIPEDVRRSHPKLPNQKFIVQDNPFEPGDTLCLVPTPRIDVACIHVQKASADGTCRIEGPQFQDMDIAIAAKHTIISCEELLSEEEMRKNPELNTLPGLCVNAVVVMPMGAHPSQCYHHYDYDSSFFWEYEHASRTETDFQEFLKKRVLPHETQLAYLKQFGESHLSSLKIQDVNIGYVPGLQRGRPDIFERKMEK